MNIKYWKEIGGRYTGGRELVGTFEIDDDAIVALLEKILLKQCIKCNGDGQFGAATCPICYGTGKIRRIP